jgi:hypothetical protein
MKLWYFDVISNNDKFLQRMWEGESIEISILNKVMHKLLFIFGEYYHQFWYMHLLLPSYGWKQKYVHHKYWEFWHFFSVKNDKLDFKQEPGKNRRALIK